MYDMTYIICIIIYNKCRKSKYICIHIHMMVYIPVISPLSASRIRRPTGAINNQLGGPCNRITSSPLSVLSRYKRIQFHFDDDPEHIFIFIFFIFYILLHPSYAGICTNVSLMSSGKIKFHTAKQTPMQHDPLKLLHCCILYLNNILHI